jgi:endonuclease/exonuclease/phosphatase family metal-dependent hydrolase
MTGSLRTESPAFEITLVNRPARPARRTLKVVVFNARTGARYEGILACLRRPPLADADVILLCEADWRLQRSFNREIAADLAAALGMSFAYGPEFTFRRPSGVPLSPSFLGNAILSAAPLADVRMIPLPTFPITRRRLRLVGQPRALVATAEFGGRRLTIALAHLDSRWHPAGRANQIATLLEHLAPSGAVGTEGLASASDPPGGADTTDAGGAPYVASPVILGGDFNTTTVSIERESEIAMVAARMTMQPWRFRYPERYEPLFEHLARAGFEIRGANVPGKATFTFSRAIPPLMRPKLDWIALRGLEPIPGSARVVTARASFFSRRVSDHDFVLCEIRL